MMGSESVPAGIENYFRTVHQAITATLTTRRLTVGMSGLVRTYTGVPDQPIISMEIFP
ncbi:hypothetical protein LPH50_05905 [Xylella taiwanensis]|uniref:Uncharacterized protein n=1 Tax=Xylella taiwanensis TaxID=1444770 RepID=A0ABS8TV16_9GAMM|nr:hypothetical protein [Xylella taiwanensis]MCD8460047.1 hypothetical protein [Xylella taiwanensis]MCD8467889.1 hypothetical protein [Xylella taiwanensis]MCD8469775.1 hypothetical protein [Xylella taiwanensis]MCD8472836.1 hypothetical protein [Xylella taiwanensis]UFN01311.1 hypothetical protein LPH43_05980 [Xylella taiwanensis]